MVCREIFTAYCKNYRVFLNKLCGKDAGLSSVKTADIEVLPCFKELMDFN
jgi:hypothetical protein